MGLLIPAMCVPLGIAARGFADQANLVANGSFESSIVSPGAALTDSPVYLVTHTVNEP